MNLSAPFVRRPIGTALLAVGLILAGVAAFFSLPVSPLPQVDFPTIGVSASLPGASPDTMATSVATPLERRLGRIADVSEMTSRSNVGSTSITLQFGLNRNIDGAARDVMAAINAARADLPATLRSNPTYRKRNPADAPIMVVAMTSKTKTPGQIYDAAATVVQQQLSQVRGVGEVEVGGGSLPAVRVELNPLALAKYGIALEDVRAALSSANANRPKGVVEDKGRRFQIYTNDAGTAAADYAPLIIAHRNGAAVRLADVADVQDSVEDVHNLGLFNGQPAVVVIISRQPGANIIATVEAVKKRLPIVQSALPGDIAMQVANDRTLTIRASLHEVEGTLLISILLVVAVTAFFLRSARSTLIPATAVIVSLLGTLGAMYLLGFSLNNLSLMALTVATGFVVDDAIVVLENVTRHVEEGMPRFQAALLGAREVGFTVLSISVSLVAVFIPILLMGGIVGRLFREFAVSLSAAILVSLLISLTVTPMMCAYLIRPPKSGRQGWFARVSERTFDGMQRIYRRGLTWALDAGPVVLAILVCTIALNVYLFTIVPKGFFPQQDTGQLMGGFRLDQSSSFQASRDRLIKFVNIVRADPAVENVVAFQGGRGGSSGGFLMVSLKPKSQRKSGGQAVVQRLRPKLAQVTGASLFLNPVQDVRVGGRQSNATYQYTLQSDDLAQLRTWATKLSEAMKRQPALTDVNTDQEDHGLESYVTIDRDKAASLGLSARDVDNTLYDAFGQRQVSTIYKDLNQYHVIMEVDPRFATDPTSLKDVYVARSARTTATGLSATSTAASVNGGTGAASTGGSVGSTGATGLGTGGASTSNTGSGSGVAAGANASTGFEPSAPPSRDQSAGSALSTTAAFMVPLSSIAGWADGSTPTSVNHQDLSVATTISFNLADSASLSDATVAIQQAQAEIGMPATVHGSFQGTAQVFQESLANEPVLIAAALLAVYIVLGVLYESYVHPLTVLSTLPSAGVGAVLALILFKTEFSIIALIGVVLLIGIVEKNAIMIIDFALDAERSRGLSSRDAVFEACMLRFRPIMMTTFAAMLGALPLAIGWGEGAELRRPLGITIIGGLLLSQVITLLTTPVVYLYLDQLRRRHGDERHLGRTGPAPTQAAPQGA